MISVEIPNDIVEYKPKFILGLTGRQVVCVLITAFVIWLDIKFLMPYIGDFAIALAVIPAVIAAMFGWGSPYGMTFERYLKSVFVQAFIAPKTRKYKTSGTSFVVPCDKYYVPISDSEISPELLEHVNYVKKSLGMNIEETTENTKNKKKAKKVIPKYKKSKLAML